MKLCRLSLGVALVIALTTSVECVPHERLARATAAKPKAANRLTPILLGVVKSLSNTVPTTNNAGLDAFTGAIVKAKIVQTDSKNVLTKAAVTKLATDVVSSLSSASGTSKANETKLLTFVKKGIKSCKQVDCVVKQVGEGGNFFNPVIVDQMQELQTEIGQMNTFAPLQAMGGFGGADLSSMLNGFGGGAGGGGLDSILKGFGTDTSKLTSMLQNAGGAAGAAVPAVKGQSLDSMIGNLQSSNMDLSSLLGMPGTQGFNAASNVFGGGSVPGDGQGFDGMGFQNLFSGFSVPKGAPKASFAGIGAQTGMSLSEMLDLKASQAAGAAAAKTSG